MSGDGRRRSPCPHPFRCVLSPVSCPIAFSATECLDIGVALGSAVSPDYYDKKPFKFNGTINRVDIKYVSPT